MKSVILIWGFSWAEILKIKNDIKTEINICFILSIGLNCKTNRLTEFCNKNDLNIFTFFEIQSNAIRNPHLCKKTRSMTKDEMPDLIVSWENLPYLITGITENRINMSLLAENAFYINHPKSWRAAWLIDWFTEVLAIIEHEIENHSSAGIVSRGRKLAKKLREQPRVKGWKTRWWK